MSTHPARSATKYHPFAGRDVPWLVDQRALDRPDKNFLVWEPVNAPRRSWTYAAFADETRAYAAGLAAKGVQVGDFITLHMDNCPEFLFIWFACARLGAIVVTTNTRSAEDEVSYFLSHSNSIAAITQPKYAAMIRRAAPDLKWIACTATDCDEPPTLGTVVSGTIPFAGLRGDPGQAPVARHDALAPNSIQYTSGTTSRPKGVVWTHANALWQGRVTAGHARLTHEDVHLVYFPLFHTNALGYSMLSTLWSGGTVVLMPKFSASRFWDVSVRNGCTWANVVMFTIRALEAQPDPVSHRYKFWYGPGDLSSVRERWNIKTNGWYGMTETVSQCFVTDPDVVGPEGAMGWPAQEYETSIRRVDGTEVSVHETGHLWIRGIRGLSIFQGYLNDPEATARAFDADGWFDTGDEVMPVESGHAFFIGREKDMLRVGGENVAALEIETVVAGIPGIVECAVVGKPDDMLDEVPVVFVVATQPNAALEAQIRTECERALADFKRPREIHFIENLPKGLLDKTLKKELRALLKENGA